MDVFEIVRQIDANNQELHDAGISVIIAAVRDKKETGDMRLCVAGNMLDQLRGLAALFFTLKKQFITSSSQKRFDDLWQAVLCEQAFYLMMDEKTEE